MICRKVGRWRKGSPNAGSRYHYEVQYGYGGLKQDSSGMEARQDKYPIAYGPTWTCRRQLFHDQNSDRITLSSTDHQRKLQQRFSPSGVDGVPWALHSPNCGTRVSSFPFPLPPLPCHFVNSPGGHESVPSTILLVHCSVVTTGLRLGYPLISLQIVQPPSWHVAFFPSPQSDRPQSTPFLGAQTTKRSTSRAWHCA